MTTTNADRKLLALALGSVIFTTKELAERLEYLVNALKNGLSPTEQKTYADFVDNPGGLPLLNVSADHTQARDFANLARQDGVDVSVKRDQTEKTYYLCLHGRQEDIIKAATEYQKRLRDKQRPRSLTAELEREKAGAASRAAEQTKTQERRAVDRDGRNP